MFEKFGKNNNYRIGKGYNQDDIDLYRDISDLDSYIIGISVTAKDKLEEDIYLINDQNYFIGAIINHDTELLHDLNFLLKEILTCMLQMKLTRIFIISEI